MLLFSSELRDSLTPLKQEKLVLLRERKSVGSLPENVSPHPDSQQTEKRAKHR